MNRLLARPPGDAPAGRRVLLQGAGKAVSAILCVALIIAVLVSCSKPQEEGRKVKMYQSPMHPWITSDKPGNCTICGMALVPVYEGEAGMETKEGVISLNPRSDRCPGCDDRAGAPSRVDKVAALQRHPRR